MRAWADFRAALRELGEADPQRAEIYLREAAGGLRSWLQGLRSMTPRSQSDQASDEPEDCRRRR